MANTKKMPEAHVYTWKWEQHQENAASGCLHPGELAAWQPGHLQLRRNDAMLY